MISVLQSIKPQYIELIAAGKKTIEVRKTRPKIQTPFKVYIYCTKDKIPFILPTYSKGGLTDSDVWKVGNGKVIGEYVCDYITTDFLISDTCISVEDLEKYSGNKAIYGWHISNLKIYDKPKELSEFRIIDKEYLPKCPYRLRIYNNPDYTNGALLKGSYQENIAELNSEIEYWKQAYKGAEHRCSLMNDTISKLRKKIKKRPPAKRRRP